MFCEGVNVCYPVYQQKTGRQKHVMSLLAVILVSFLQCDELSADPLYDLIVQIENAVFIFIKMHTV